MKTPSILKLDMYWRPHDWISVQDAVSYYHGDMVMTDMGEDICTYHGGVSKFTGLRSEITPKSIIVVRGEFRHADAKPFKPYLSKKCNDLLFTRDRNVCAYCGRMYRALKLEREHVIPRHQGGKDVWTNVVTSCRPCNQEKKNRTPEQAGMQLLYVPYTPDRYEHFILTNRQILADQMEFLLQKVPKHSRLLVERKFD